MDTLWLLAAIRLEELVLSHTTASSTPVTLAGLTRAVYLAAGPPWRKRFGLLKRFLLLPRSLRLARVEIEIPNLDGSPWHAVYIGEIVALPYLLECFNASVLSYHPSAIPLHRLPAAVRQASASHPLVITDVNRSLQHLLPPGGWSTSPWIRQEVRLDSPHYAHSRSGIEANYGRLVRKHGFRGVVTRDLATIKRFYSEFYVPYVAARHGAGAILQSWAELRLQFRSAFLMQVFDGGRWLAGALATASGSRLRILAAAAHPGAFPDLRRGCLSAAYYFLLRHAPSLGCTIVDFGGTRPHADDGLFLHKRHWGAEAHSDPWHHTALSLYFNSAALPPRAVAQLLIQTPEGYSPLISCLSSVLSQNTTPSPASSKSSSGQPVSSAAF